MQWRVASLLIGMIIVSLVAGVHPDSGAIRQVDAASGCYDLDGDGIVHLADYVIKANWHLGTIPPAPPQVDFNKDGTLSVGDQGAIISAFDQAMSCQTDPLPKTAMTDGALAADSNGESPVPSDTIETTRQVDVGETFHVAVHVTSNPGAVGYQARLTWASSLLELNPRTGPINIVAPFTNFSFEVQASGPNYIEVINAPYDNEQVDPSAFTGPVAQFEFTCIRGGITNLTLVPGHTFLGNKPDIEYTPTLSNAQIECVCPGGCPVGGIAELAELARGGTSTQASDRGGWNVVLLTLLVVVGSVVVAGGALWGIRRARR